MKSAKVQLVCIPLVAAVFSEFTTFPADDFDLRQFLDTSLFFSCPLLPDWEKIELD